MNLQVLNRVRLPEVQRLCLAPRIIAAMNELNTNYTTLKVGNQMTKKIPAAVVSGKKTVLAQH